MAKRSRSEIEQAIADLQTELDTADTDDEVWVKEGGREVKVTGRRATSILSRFADLWDTGDGEDDGDGDGDGEEEPPAKPDPKPAGGGYFGKRRG